MAEKNEAGKTRKVNEPYEIWVAPGFEWRVLKKYQAPSKEAANPYARWLCAVKGPGTFDSYDTGDTYVREITNYAVKLSPREVEAHLKKHVWRQD